MIVAVEGDDSMMIQLLRLYDCVWDSRIYEISVRTQNRDTMDLLYRLGCPWNGTSIIAALENKDLTLAKLLYDRGCTLIGNPGANKYCTAIGNRLKTLRAAVLSEDVAFLEWIIRVRNHYPRLLMKENLAVDTLFLPPTVLEEYTAKTNTIKTGNFLLNHGSVPMMECLKKHGLWVPISSPYDISNSSLEVIDWACRNRYNSYDARVVCPEYRRDIDRVVEIIDQKYNLTQSLEGLIEGVVRGDRIDLFAEIVRKCNTDPAKYQDCVARCGSWELIRYIVETEDLHLDSEFLDRIANRNLSEDQIEYLVLHGHRSSSKSIIRALISEDFQKANRLHDHCRSGSDAELKMWIAGSQSCTDKFKNWARDKGISSVEIDMCDFDDFGVFAPTQLSTTLQVIESGDIDKMENLWTAYRNSRDRKKLSRLAVRYNQPKFIEWILKRTNTNYPFLYSVAIEYKHYSLIPRLKCWGCEPEADTFELAAQMEDFVAVQILHRIRCPCSEKVFGICAQLGNYQMAYWLYQNKYPYDLRDFRLFPRSGNIQIQLWIDRHKPESKNSEYLPNEARSKRDQKRRWNNRNQKDRWK
jgi:hypothetical protein